MKKICCYTCITGGYDSSKPICNQSKNSLDNVDFICFNDKKLKLQDGWISAPIPKCLSGLSDVRKSRILKTQPYKFLKDYAVSLWIDGNIEIVGDILKFVKNYDLDKTSLFTRIHPTRNCIYAEAKACIDLKKDQKALIEAQMKRYQSERYPKKIGLAETNVMLRKHSDLKCQKVCDVWTLEIASGSFRDQLSFNYACWKSHFLPGWLNDEFSLVGRRANTFKLFKHI